MAYTATTATTAAIAAINDTNNANPALVDPAAAVAALRMDTDGDAEPPAPRPFTGLPAEEPARTAFPGLAGRPAEATAAGGGEAAASSGTPTAGGGATATGGQEGAPIQPVQAMGVTEIGPLDKDGESEDFGDSWCCERHWEAFEFEVSSPEYEPIDPMGEFDATLRIEGGRLVPNLAQLLEWEPHIFDGVNIPGKCGFCKQELFRATPLLRRGTAKRTLFFATVPWMWGASGNRPVGGCPNQEGCRMPSYGRSGG